MKKAIFYLIIGFALGVLVTLMTGYLGFKAELRKRVGYHFYYMAHEFITGDDKNLIPNGHALMYYSALEKNPYAQGTVIASALSGHYMPVEGERITKVNRQIKYSHLKFPFSCKMVKGIVKDFPFQVHDDLGQCMIDEKCNGNELVGEELALFCEGN